MTLGVAATIVARRNVQELEILLLFLNVDGVEVAKDETVAIITR